MSSYVLSFRGKRDRSPSPTEEGAWMQWFQQIGGSISDSGHRVGASRALGAANGRPDVLSGCIVVNAGSLDEAERLATGCPGIAQGGGVEIAEIVEM